MSQMSKSHQIKASSVLGMLSLCLIICLLPLQVFAFEGDYIWEERFKSRLARAQAGQLSAQYVVAGMYSKGRGTAVNPDKALHWYLRAAKQGHTKAAYKAGYLYLYNEDISTRATRKEAFHWIKKAADAGYAPAQFELGRLFFEGDIVNRDEALALKWLGQAKQANYAPAQLGFDQMVKSLVEEQSRLSERPEASTALARVKLTDREAQVVSDLPDPKGIILSSKWGSNEGPSTFLPSRLTQCRESDNGIECLSSKLDMQLSSTRVVYRTRARITDISPDGHFRLSYANNVLSTGDDTTGDTTAEAVSVKSGWQRNEHVLDCSLVAGLTISCAQGTSKQYRFFGRY